MDKDSDISSKCRTFRC